MNKICKLLYKPTNRLIVTHNIKNKYKMKEFLAIFLIVAGVAAKSQTKVGYTYDLNGNRIARYFIGQKPAPDTNPEDTTAVSQATPGQVISDPKAVAIKYGVDVYPNPTQDLVMIKFNKEGLNPQSIRATVYLFDNSGRQLEQKNYNGSEISFDLSSNPPGTYNMKIVFKNEESTFYQVIKVN